MKKGIEEFATFSRVLNASLVDREYLCARLTIADFCLTTYVTVLDDCGLDLAPYRNVAAWRDRMVARSSLRRAPGCGSTATECLARPAMQRTWCKRR